jgi:hypothetical protein
MATSDGVREVSLLSVVVQISRGLGALVVIVFLLQIVASEVGEVVILTTVDATGEPVETRLWVVDLDGRTWLRGPAHHDSRMTDPVRLDPVIAPG